MRAPALKPIRTRGRPAHRGRERVSASATNFQIPLIAAGLIAAAPCGAHAAESAASFYDGAALEALILAATAPAADGAGAAREESRLAAADLPIPDIPLPEVRIEAAPAAPAARAKSPADRAPSLAEDFAVIVELRFERYVLSDGLIAYDEGGRLYAPLGQIAAALDFAISVDLAAGTASGWFLDESRGFSLDLSQSRVVAAGERMSLDAADAAAGFDDIYVDLALLERWFPVTPVYTRSALLVEIASREPLPVEQRLERARTQAGLARAGAGARADLPHKDERYGLIDAPFIDLSANADASTGGGGNFTSAHSIYLAGDLAWMTGEVALNGSDRRALDDVRLTLSRRDPDGDMLGPLAATVVEVGDIFSPQLTLSGRSARGRGASLSNFPLQRSSEFDQVIIRGQMPAGWDAELYRNDVLLAAQSSRPDGLYEFLDVQLVTGENILRVELYGPQGQRRTETRRFTIGEGLVKPGETRFRLTAVQNERDIIDVRETNGAVADEEGELRAVFELEQGLTKRFSIVGSAEIIPQDGDQRAYFGAGFRAAALGAYTRLDISVADDGGVAAQGATQLELLGVNALAEHTELFNYESEQFQASGDPIRRETDIRLDGSLGGEKFFRVPYALSLRREERDSGATRLELAARASTTLGPVNASNTLTYSDNTGSASRLTGSSVFNTRFSELSLRANAEYEVRPAARLNSVSAIADRRIGRELSLRGEVTRRLSGERETVFGVGVNWLLPIVSVGFDAAYGTNSDFRAGLSLSASFGREPREGVWRGSPQAFARSGAASARVFLDRDLDGKFSDGDEPVEGARFRGGGENATGADGIALLTGLSADQPVDVELDIVSLADPYWEPGNAGFEVVPRPGHATLLDFPVYETGEIDGVVYLEADDKRTPVSNAEVELVDASGAVVATAKSSFDGFYLLEKVRPGTYQLRISPAQITRLGLEESAPAEIIVEGGDGAVSTRDFVLRR